MTSETDEVIEPCTICHKPRAAHNYRHAWTGFSTTTSALFEQTGHSSGGDQPATGDPVTQGRVRIASTGDPVLRMVLLRKGIITVEDLNAVEEELRATGVAGYEPPTTVG